MAELVMSTGLFIGVRYSYIEEAQASAEAFVDSINHVLLDIGVEPYLDPYEPPNVYTGHLFGRSGFITILHEYSQKLRTLVPHLDKALIWH
jgi:hypothetical protein